MNDPRDATGEALSVDDPPDVVFRRPVEADHAAVLRVVDTWWHGRRWRGVVTRTWFRHASGTSWLVESDDGRLLGFAIAYPSPDDRTTGILQAVATSPNRRRAGLGRALLERVTADLRGRGARRMEAIGWPDDPVATGFLRACGFRADDASGTMRLYGTPAYPDYEGEGEDRVRFIRDL